MLLIVFCSIFLAIHAVEFADPSNENFDYFLFAQMYPEAICKAMDDHEEDSCLVPSNSSHWIIHGLWPQNEDGSYPQYCDLEHNRFDLDQISNITFLLRRIWPNLLTKQLFYSLWKHEWEKHGSCSTGLSAVNGEYKYFFATARLFHKYNMFRLLKSIGILPSDTTTYSSVQLQSLIATAVDPSKSIRNLEIHCVYDKKEDRWYFASVRICINKKLKLINCPTPSNTESVAGIQTVQQCPKNNIHYITQSPKKFRSYFAALFEPVFYVAQLLQTIVLNFHPFQSPA